MTNIIQFTQTNEKGDHAAAGQAANDGRVVKIVPKTAREKVAFQVSEMMAGMKTVKGRTTLNSFRKGLQMASENIQEFVVEQAEGGKPRDPMQFLVKVAAVLKKMSSH